MFPLVNTNKDSFQILYSAVYVDRLTSKIVNILLYSVVFTIRPKNITIGSFVHFLM